MTAPEAEQLNSSIYLRKAILPFKYAASRIPLLIRFEVLFDQGLLNVALSLTKL